jgi:CheY-like chemotaxis protein
MVSNAGSHKMAYIPGLEPDRELPLDLLLRGFVEGPDCETVQEPIPMLESTETILLVDDDVTLLRVHTKMLELLGYRVSPINGGIDALDAFRIEPDGFHLVITDQMMPGMTGLELAKELRLIRAGIPIILCTGTGISERTFLDSGVRALLRKPVDMEDLAKTIRRVLHGKKKR